MTENKKKIWGGLLPTPLEQQKFSFGAVFGYPKVEELPDEFLIGEPIEIKNQNIPSPSFVCVAESLCAVSEYQEAVALEPAFTIKLISELEGDPNWVWRGTSLDKGAKASLKGFLERKESPLSVEKDGLNKVAEPKNWSSAYTAMAEKHKKQDYFWIGVSGKLKMFDAIRSAMWRFKDEKRAIQTGIIWNVFWEDIVFIDKETTEAGGHAIAIIGWKGDYLKIQNSIGMIGENGCQWIHKDLVNRLFKFGALMYMDMPSGETKESVLEKSKWFRASWLGKLLLLIQKYVAEIFS